VGDNITGIKDVSKTTMKQAEYWDCKARHYDAFYGYETLYGRLKIERKAQMLIEKATIDACSDVLEIGCGTGVFTREIAKTGAYIKAIDVSPEMLAIAGKQPQDNIHYIKASAYQLHNGNNVFDAVVGTYVLQYLDLDRVLSEIYRVLKWGCTMAFVEPNALNPLAWALTRCKAINQWAGRPKEATSFYPSQIKAKLIQHGFTDIEIKPLEFMPNGIPAWLVDLALAGNWLFEHTPLIRWLAGSLLIMGRKEIV